MTQFLKEKGISIIICTKQATPICSSVYILVADEENVNHALMDCLVLKLTRGRTAKRKFIEAMSVGFRDLSHYICETAMIPKTRTS